jgi:glycyl-radical enzyme activating protein
MTSGIVLAIERGSLHDGPGIRTSVFLKGCPLKCLWCHNPESQSMKPIVFKVIDRCQHCGECIKVCPNNCITLDGIDRSLCTICGQCVEACNNSALEIKGTNMTVDEVMKEVLKDKAYYQASGGGITISGGEPLLQWKFSSKLLKRSKELDIHTCVETCGFGTAEHIAELAKYTDLFYYDIKATKLLHKKLTGVDNKIILDNLGILNELNAKVVLRCPLVPGVNDEESHLLNIAALAEQYDSVVEVHPLPYHPLAESKRRSIGMDKSDMPKDFATKEEYQKWVDILKANTTKPIIETSV